MVSWSVGQLVGCSVAAFRGVCGRIVRMDKRQYRLLRRIAEASDIVIVSGEEAVVAKGLMDSGMIEGEAVRAFGDEDFTFVCRSVTDRGSAALGDLNGNAQEVAVSDTAEGRPSWFRRNRDSIIVGILTSSIVAILFKLLEPYVFGGE